MDVAAWLRGLGLERYVPAFRDNEIDWEALPKLTVEDLKDLGVEATAASSSTQSLRSAPKHPPPMPRCPAMPCQSSSAARACTSSQCWMAGT